MNPKVVIVGGTGYAGSALFIFLREHGYAVDSVDLENYGNSVNPSNLMVDYCRLSESFWKRYDTILLFAGLANVAACSRDMAGTFHHNVENFVDLLGKISRDQKLIYASTSNIYGMTGSVEIKETHDRFQPANHYDLSKKVIDLYAQVHAGNYFGLRLATVNGASPNLRVDVMINKMYHDAQTSGKITIMNPKVNRPILGLQDLCRSVLALMQTKSEPGFYNLASFNSNVQHLSEEVSSHLGGIEIVNAGESPTYDFAICTEKFRKSLDFTFKETISTIIESLDKTYSTCLHTVR